ncbi:MAG: formyltetrahydrofolate deformylase, partial [Actinomycetota bacterium]
MKHVVLLLSCQDRPGIVAGVTGWLVKIGGNITDAQQHTDHHDGMFFQRVKFTPPEGVSVPDLESKFRAVANDLKLNYQFCTLPFRPRTAILVSRHLHCLSDVLSRVQLDDVPIDVQFVASNHDDGREISEMFGYRFIHLPIEAWAATRLEQEAHLSRLLDKQSLDLVILARYMMVLPKHIVEPWFGRMINIHHSFLPSFVGANPYRQAHDRGVKVIG